MDDLPTNDDVRGAWDENAGFWDRRLSEPHSWQQTLIFPAIERLLDPRADERILEVACGTGLLARRMAAAGAKVVATDFSEAMLARAGAARRYRRRARPARPHDHRGARRPRVVRCRRRIDGAGIPGQPAAQW